MGGNGVDPEPITAVGFTDGGGAGCAILRAAAAARDAATAVLGSFLIS